MSSLTGHAAAQPLAERPITAGAATLAILVCAIWGANQTAVKIANEGMSPIFQCAMRSLLAMIVLGLWCRWRGIAVVRFDRILPWGLLVGVMFTLEFAALYKGLGMTNVSRGILFIYVSPFVGALGAHFIVPGERLTPIKLLGLLCAFLGLSIAMWNGLSLPNPEQFMGDMLCLFMGTLWGLEFVVLKATVLREAESERVVFYDMAVSAVLLLPLAYLLGEPGLFDPTPRVLLAFAYTVVIVSFGSYVVFVWLIKRYSAAVVGSFIFLSPIFAVLVAGLMLGEPLTPHLLVALALNALGIWLVNRPAPPVLVPAIPRSRD